MMVDVDPRHVWRLSKLELALKNGNLTEEQI
jgi:hypothetical protein